MGWVKGWAFRVQDMGIPQWLHLREHLPQDPGPDPPKAVTIIGIVQQPIRRLVGIGGQNVNILNIRMMGSGALDL